LSGIFGVFVFPGPRIGRRIEKWLDDRKNDNDKKGPPAPTGGAPAPEPNVVRDPHPFQPMQRIMPEPLAYPQPLPDFLAWEPEPEAQPDGVLVDTGDSTIFYEGDSCPIGEEDSGFGAETAIGIGAVIASKVVPIIVDNAPKVGNAIMEFGGRAAGALSAATGAVFSFIPSFAVDVDCIMTEGCVENGGVDPNAT
jgi:hypothetical protein